MKPATSTDAPGDEHKEIASGPASAGTPQPTAPAAIDASSVKLEASTSTSWRPGRFDLETGKFTPAAAGTTDPYTVTPRAGPRVAGRRAKPQQDIELTPEEAASELLSGAIVHKGSKLHPQLLANAKPKPTSPEES